MADIIALKDYYKKLQRIINFEGEFTFFDYKLVKKSKIDDILCCILATLPADYKSLMNQKLGVKLNSITYYKLLFDAITDIDHELIEKAYKVSPKFAELKEYFEKETFNWAICGDGISTEIQGGWFHWALMRAVESKGYYKDAKTANEYYQQVADEINEACDNGEIKALKYKIV